MKFLHITDTHATGKTPAGRTDVYYIEVLRKFVELKYVIELNHIDFVLHTGDLFHTPRVSNKFMGQLAEIIRSWGVPVYVVPGNHDLDGYNIDTIEQTSLGLFEKTGVVRILSRENPLRMTIKNGGFPYEVAISGQEYYAGIDNNKNQKNFSMDQPRADINILGIHSYLVPVKTNPEIPHTVISDIYSDADLVLVGHEHNGYSEYVDANDVSYINPGSALRIEETAFNVAKKPQYGICETGCDEDGPYWDYTLHSFRCANPGHIAFANYSASVQAKKTISSTEQFLATITANMKHINVVSAKIEDVLDTVCQTNQIEQTLHAELKKRYASSLMNSPDQIGSKITGYIEATTPKTIASIELVNFQAHKHTKLDLSQDMNVIVGESNQGKTSIIRALSWCFYNDLTGDSFITTGESECSVQVTFQTGEFIKRIKKKTKGGFNGYEVGALDENGNLIINCYSGFGATPPVEIANIHQMPKVDLTKDVSSVLNLNRQLDVPFLITESPNVKASAIGRITGTHVVDLALKELNHDKLADKAVLKSKQVSLKAEEEKLKGIKDITAIKQAETLLSSILPIMEQKYSDICELQKMQQQLASLNQKIATELAIKQKAEQCLLQPINPILSLFDHIKQTKESAGLIHHINQTIQTQRDIICKCHTLKNVSINTIQMSYANMKQLNSMNQLFTECQIKIEQNMNFKNQIVSALMKQDFMSEYSSLKEVMDTKETLQSVEQQSAKLQQTIQTQQQSIVKNLSDIKELKLKVADEIIENKVCPCCGQAIDESHGEHIFNYIVKKEN